MFWEIPFISYLNNLFNFLNFMKKLTKSFLLIFCILFTTSLLIFSVLSYLNWSLLTGFLLGVLISIINYLLNELFFIKLLSKKRKFFLAFFLTNLKHLVWLVLFSGTFIGILFANNLLKNMWTDGIFNIYTFIYGSLFVAISIITENFWQIIKDKKKERRRK